MRGQQRAVDLARSYNFLRKLSSPANNLDNCYCYCPAFIERLAYKHIYTINTHGRMHDHTTQAALDETKGTRQYAMPNHARIRTSEPFAESVRALATVRASLHASLDSVVRRVVIEHANAHPCACHARARIMRRCSGRPSPI